MRDCLRPRGFRKTSDILEYAYTEKKKERALRMRAREDHVVTVNHRTLSMRIPKMDVAFQHF